MLRITNISKTFGETLLFDQVNLVISEGEKIGVVGANGCGKSTFLKLIAGRVDIDTGGIDTPGRVSKTYLPQQLDDVLELNVGSYLAPDWFEAHRILKLREEELEGCGQSDDVLLRYTAAFAAFESCGGYELENQLDSTLASLRMHDVSPSRELSTLSGGERTKVALARVLMQPADLMLLDEPTNNLDQTSMEWLERKLQQSKSACIIVSHDRKFLDRVTTRTLEIDRTSTRITSYSGNYSWYKERKRQDEDRQLRQFKEQQTRINRLTADIRAVKNQALVTERSTQNDYIRGRSKKVAAKAKAREARLTRILELEKIESPRFAQRPKLYLSGNLQYSSTLIEAQDLTFENGKTILSELNFSIVGSSRVVIIGDNGSGKSTLLKLIVQELSPSAGTITRKSQLRLGYLPQNGNSLSDPDDSQTVLGHFKSLNAESKSDSDIRTLLHRFQFAGNDVFKPLGVLSRGERTKLMLASFMASNLDLLIMDEPTNHLDLETIECFEEALNMYQGALVVVSHDRYFLEKLSPDCIWQIHDGTIKTKWSVKDMIP